MRPVGKLSDCGGAENSLRVEKRFLRSRAIEFLKEKGEEQCREGGDGKE